MANAITQRNKHTQITPSSFSERSFISDIYECEKERFILDAREKKIEDSIEREYRRSKGGFNQSSFYNSWRKEIKGKTKNVPVPEKPSIFFFVFYMIIFGGVAFGILLILGVILMIFGSSTDAIGIVVYITWGVIFAGFIGTYIYQLVQYRKAIKRNIDINIENRRNADHNNAREAYWKERHKESCAAAYREAEAYEESCQPELQAIRAKRSAVNQTLDMLYNLRIDNTLCLHPNYQGIIPISTIYGYFDTGRCTQLKGHEGAYNIYEEERQRGEIIERLDKLSGDLRGAMLYIGKTMQDCNRQLRRMNDIGHESLQQSRQLTATLDSVSGDIRDMSSHMAAIESNTANGAYYAEVGARMSAITAAYTIMNN